MMNSFLDDVVSLIPRIKKSSFRLFGLRLVRSEVVAGALSWQIKGSRFRFPASTSTFRFNRVSSQLAARKQLLDSHFCSIGQVATSNVSRSKFCCANHSTDPVTGLSLFRSRSSIRQDSVRPPTYLAMRSNDSSRGTGEPTANHPLALSSARSDADRALYGSPIAVSVPNYQNNSPRSIVPKRVPDRSMRKPTQDEKRNVDQCIAIGRMPDCDR